MGPLPGGPLPPEGPPPPPIDTSGPLPPEPPSRPTRPQWLLPLVAAGAAVLLAAVIVALAARDDGDDELSEDSSPAITTATTGASTLAPSTTAGGVEPSEAPEDTTAATDATTTTSTAAPETTTSGPPPTDATTMPPVPAWPPGLVLTQAAADGVHAVSGDGDVAVAGGQYEIAFAVGDGSFVVQRHSGRGAVNGTETEISRVGSVEAVVVAGTSDAWHTLHDVEIVSGRPLALISTATGSTPDDASEQLHLYDLAGGTSTPVMEIGAWESGTSRLHLADGLIVGEWSAEVQSGPLFVDFDGNPAIDPATLGLQDSYDDCAGCPHRFSVNAGGDLIGWVEGGNLVVYDLAAGARIAEIPLGGPTAGSIDSIQLASGSAVVNPFGSSLEALEPVLVGNDGSLTPLARRGFATVD